MLDLFASGAPLVRRRTLIKSMLRDAVPPIFGLGGVDTMLLGQQVPTQLLPTAEPLDQWQARKRAADVLVSRAIPQRAALAAFTAEPELLRELFDDPDSWAGPRWPAGA
jgi:hypothetical protein